MALAVLTDDQVAEVSGMVWMISRSAMPLADRIEVAAQTAEVDRAQNALFMDVDAMLPRMEYGNVGDHMQALGILMEAHRAVAGTA